jgi:hypothetical protein
MPIFVSEPPPQYVHRFSGPVIERVLPLAEARRLCARMGAPADGCAWTSKGRCYIVIPSNGPVRDLGAYRRHEIAHCNGWGHHGGSVSVRTAQRRLPYLGAAGGGRRQAQKDMPFPGPDPKLRPEAY